MPRSDDSDDDDVDDASSDTKEEVSLPSSLLFSSLMPLRLSLIAPPLLFPEQIVNENFLLCRRQGRSHLLSASTKSVSNGCD